MTENISDSLSPERRDYFIDRIVAWTMRRRLEAPMIVMLESIKPLAFIGAHAFMVAAAILVPFIGQKIYKEIFHFIQEREHFELLLAKFEEKIEQKKQEKILVNNIENNIEN